MKFGKSWEDVQKEPQGGGGDFMKYFKKGDTTFRIIQEPKDWLGYWEHYNPGGFPFPCNQEDRDNCPGCQSSNPKMSKASRKVATNVLEGEFVNVYKMPKTVADVLDNRAQRIGTITDRDYTISRIEGRNTDGSTKTTYDIEGGDKIPVDISKLEMRNIEEMLSAAYEESWGDSDRAKQTKAKNDEASEDDKLRAKLKATEEGQSEDPPFDSSSASPGNIYNEAELRRKTVKQLWDIALEEKLMPPKNWAELNSDEIVDWMLES